jgi:hypothetical protein
VYCQTGSYRKIQNLRVRPVPELEFCLVFTPDDPSIYTLNPTAWLIFEACDGRSGNELEALFYKTFKPLLSASEAHEQYTATVMDLLNKKVIECVA